MRRSTIDGRTALPGTALRLVLALATLLLAPLSGVAQEAELDRLAGDYRVDVHPEAFGFFVQDGVLHLKMGGVDGDGASVPLIRKDDGTFAMAEDHPNAFGFDVDGDDVGFTLYAMGNPIPGTRVGGPSTGGEADAQQQASEPEPRDPNERTRTQVLAQVHQARTALERDSGNDDVRLTYAQHLYEAGEFWTALEVASPLAEAEDTSIEALRLLSQLQYITGAYDRAEGTYERLIEATEGDVGAQVRAKVGLLFAHYQQNEFQATRGIKFPDGVNLPNAVQMVGFDEDPYELEWHTDERVAKVPFVVTDPLPVFTVEINGVPVHLLFDTGADQLIIDTEVAEGLGIESVATAMGSFGGGLQAEIGFGQVDRVKAGDVTLRRVPVTILPTKRFSSAFGEGRWPIGGIIGTSAMRQFLGTLDYENEQIVLRERTAANAAGLRNELQGSLAPEVPFVLHSSHMMMARGSLNGREGLTFFVDSGLASEAVVTVPIQTLEYLGIPEPEMTLNEDGVGGGGGQFASGDFPLERVGMGQLEQTDVRGTYGARPPSSYWSPGFIQDGLISHSFLRQYASWTLDFDSMTYLFDRGSKHP